MNHYLSKSTCAQIKGIAIIAVILCHIPRVLPMPSIIASMLRPVGTLLGPSLFLLLSGYGCGLSSQKRTPDLKFLMRRIQKMLPPLIITTLVTAVLSAVLFGKTYPPQEIITNAVGLSSSIGRFTWYVTFQYICYLVFVVIERIHDKKFARASYGLFILISMFLSCVIPISSTNMWGLYAFSFPCGVFLARYSSKLLHTADKEANTVKLLRTVACTTAIMFCALFVVTYFLLGNPDSRWIQNPLKSSLTLLAGIAVWSTALLHEITIGGGNRALSFIGVISYELYLVHGCFIFNFPEFFEKSPKLKALLFILISFALSIILHYGIDKITTQFKSKQKI